jgi:hypothetical protein
MSPRVQTWMRWLLALLAAACGWAHAQGLAPGIDLAAISVQRQESVLTLDFSARVTPSRTVEDALQRGVPVYFVAEAVLYRSRWYWRDERVARVSRTWRLAYQPLTSNWRVGVGAITQTYPSLAEALAAISRTSGWRLADLEKIDPDSNHYVEFEFRLDEKQLPGPMQIGLTGTADWVLRVERTLRVD